MRADPFAPEPYLRGARSLLSDVVAAAGGALGPYRPFEVTYRPERSVTIAYRATIRRDGATREERLALHAGRRPPAGAAPVAVDDDGNPVTAWLVPHDPALPGLPAALDPARLAALFADLGLGDAGQRVTARVKAYRPLRRAVVEATTPTARLFLKVVPPVAVEALHDRHRLVAPHVPVPPSIGWTSTGVVVLGAMPGRTLREALGVPGAPLPDLATIEATLDRLPKALADLPGAAPAVARVDELARLLSAVCPSQATRLATLARAITEPVPDADPGPLTAAHGDLYETQLLVDGAAITGLLDVDGAGAGYRVDDLANLLGHLSVLASAHGHNAAGRLGARYLATLDATGRVDPADVRRRVAAVVLGLATGPFRVQERRWTVETGRRITLAEQWTASARRAATSRHRRAATARP